MIQVIGPIRIVTPGVLRQATESLGRERTHFACHAALFQALPSNVGKVYIGTSGLVRATLVEVAAILAIPTANTLPSFGISLTLAPAGVDLASLYLDADNTNDGVLLTILVT